MLCCTALGSMRPPGLIGEDYGIRRMQIGEALASAVRIPDRSRRLDARRSAQRGPQSPKPCGWSCACRADFHHFIGARVEFAQHSVDGLAYPNPCSHGSALIFSQMRDDRTVEPQLFSLFGWNVAVGFQHVDATGIDWRPITLSKAPGTDE